MFIACSVYKTTKSEAYNGIVDLDQVVAIDVQGIDEEYDSQIIIFHFRNATEIEWSFDDVKTRDKEFERLKKCLV